MKKVYHLVLVKFAAFVFINEGIVVGTCSMLYCGHDMPRKSKA